MNHFYNYLAMYLCILLIPFSHLLLKLGTKKDDSFVSSLVRPKIILGFFTLWLVTLLSVFSFQAVPLKTSTAWTSLTFVLTAIFSCIFLKETIQFRRWFGCTLIVLGILIFQLG
jgi:uncharacterized membrane protein